MEQLIARKKKHSRRVRLKEPQNFQLKVIKVLKFYEDFACVRNCLLLVALLLQRRFIRFVVVSNSQERRPERTVAHPNHL